MSPKQLSQFLQHYPRLTVLSGAGCSTDSGIPDYRDDDGNWKHARPVQYADFVRDRSTRRRYWVRSYAGWHRISEARPNAAHVALARLESVGRVACLITQNVDNLHRRAGSRNVIDLHGVLHKVRCLACGETTSREHMQGQLAALNPLWEAAVAGFAPDGDVRLSAATSDDFAIPACAQCGGILKPDVVFFGETVPPDRVQLARRQLTSSDALLVIGSSLMVWSGYRFARLAAELGKPLAIINRGRTRADDLADCKVSADCAESLSQLVSDVRRITEATVA